MAEHPSLAATLRNPPADDAPPVVGHYQDFLAFDSCDGEGTLFGKGGRPPTGFDWYYLYDQNKLRHTRPKFIRVSQCSDFIMRGVALLDAPEFNVGLNGVTRAEISYVNITSTWYVDPKTKQLKAPHNTDGIDPRGGSTDIHIHDVYIHNGDDSVAVKLSKECTRNILVEDSVFEKGHSCSIAGSVGSGCVANVLYRNIVRVMKLVFIVIVTHAIVCLQSACHEYLQRMVSQMFGYRVKTYSDPKGRSGHVHNISWLNIRYGSTECP